VDAERQAVARRGDRIENLVEIPGRIADHVQDRPEHLLSQRLGVLQLENLGRDVQVASDPCG
jgi:hypothetical protein